MEDKEINSSEIIECNGETLVAKKKFYNRFFAVIAIISGPIFLFLITVGYFLSSYELIILMIVLMFITTLLSAILCIKKAIYKTYLHFDNKFLTVDLYGKKYQYPTNKILNIKSEYYKPYSKVGYDVVAVSFINENNKEIRMIYPFIRSEEFAEKRIYY